MSEVIEKTDAEIRHEKHNAARESLLEDIGRRREDANARLLQLRQKLAAKMAEIRRDSHAGRPQDQINVLYSHARDIDAEIRKIQSGELLGIDREFQAIQGGHHPALVGLTHQAACNAAAEKSQTYEKALADFRKAMSPEVIAAARHLVASSIAMMIRPLDVATAIADSNL